MKRVILIFVVIIMLLSLGSCDAGFAFRGNRFGDSIEQVKRIEGDVGETGYQGDYKSLSYQKEIYGGLTGSLTYYFKDDELQLIMDTYFDIKDENQEHIEDVYNNIKDTFLKYGNPTKEEILEYTMYQALWEKDGYGIALLVMDNAIILICSSDAANAKEFYSNYMYTGLFSDSESSSDINIDVVGPNFYNDPYDISSFIPLPEEGYEYTVRNSIKEKELSIFKTSPTIQQLISAFGYPPRAEINREPVMINGDVKYEKEYYIHYYVDGKMLHVKYDENCNLKKVNWDKPLNDLADTNDLDIEKPISIIRNDITRGELSFIDGETTPEELQGLLGAPHRECYNAQLFRRVRYDFIRFFMSGHYLYPLSDGGVLDVRYAKGKGNDLGVSTARIYEDSGETTVLVD